jgi:hypothetical protein
VTNQKVRKKRKKPPQGGFRVEIVLLWVAEK